MSILMVDDSPDKLLAHESILTSLGQPIVKATSGDQALRILLKQPEEFAVILLDVNMPGLSGFETAEMIRSRKSTERTPIMFVTALTITENDLFRGYSLGAVDYILTPIFPDVLKSKVGVFLDLAQQRRDLALQAEHLRKLNQELTDQTRSLSEAYKEMEAFSYTIAHDLRAPLRTVEGLTHALIDEYMGNLDETARDYGKRIKEAAARMDRMIQELLTYSRLNLVQPAIEKLSLKAVVLDALAQLQHDIEARSVQVKQSGLNQLIMAQGGILTQILTNLISNAIKFIPKDRKAELQIRAEQEGANVRVSISDNGIGIPAEFHERIFRMFERLHGPEAYPGTGIGLAIVRKGIERLGGSVGLNSEPGKGTTFWITLPKAAAEAPNVPERALV